MLPAGRHPIFHSDNEKVKCAFKVKDIFYQKIIEYLHQPYSSDSAGKKETNKPSKMPFSLPLITSGRKPVALPLLISQGFKTWKAGSTARHSVPALADEHREPSKHI